MNTSEQETKDPSFKLGQVIGGNQAADELVAYAESKTTAQAAKERRKREFEAELIRRMPLLLSWLRGNEVQMTKVRGADGYWDVVPLEGPCPKCAQLTAHLESVGLKAGGLVILTADLPLIDRVGLGSERHDRFHLEVAFTAIRKAEFEARQARRAKKATGSNHQGYAGKAARTAGLSEEKRAERHWVGIVAARTQGKGQDNASRLKARAALEEVLKDCDGDFVTAVKQAKKKGLNKAKKD